MAPAMSKPQRREAGSVAKRSWKWEPDTPLQPPQAPQPPKMLPFNNFSPPEIANQILNGETTPETVMAAINQYNGGNSEPLDTAMEMLSRAANSGPQVAPIPPQNFRATPQQPPMGEPAAPDNSMYSIPAMARALSSGVMTPPELRQFLERAGAPPYAYDNFNAAVEVARAVPAGDLDSYLAQVQNLRSTPNAPVAPQPPPQFEAVPPRPQPPAGAPAEFYTVPSIARAINAGLMTPDEMVSFLQRTEAPQYAYDNFNSAMEILSRTPSGQLESYLASVGVPPAPQQAPPQEAPPQQAPPQQFYNPVPVQPEPEQLPVWLAEPSVRHFTEALGDGTPAEVITEVLRQAQAPPEVMQNFETAFRLSNMYQNPADLRGYLDAFYPEAGSPVMDGGAPVRAPGGAPQQFQQTPQPPPQQPDSADAGPPDTGVFNPGVASMTRALVSGSATPERIMNALLESNAPARAYEDYFEAYRLVTTLPRNMVEDYLRGQQGYVPPRQPYQLAGEPQFPLPTPQHARDVADMVNRMMTGAITPEGIDAELRAQQSNIQTWHTFSDAANIWAFVPVEGMQEYLDAYVASGGTIPVPHERIPLPGSQAPPQPAEPEPEPVQAPVPVPPARVEPFSNFDPDTIARFIESGAVTPQQVFDMLNAYRPNSDMAPLSAALDIIEGHHRPPSQAGPSSAQLPFDNFDPSVIAAAIRAGSTTPYDVFRMLRDASLPPDALARALEILDESARANTNSPATAAPFDGWNPVVIADALQQGAVTPEQVGRMLDAYGMGREPLTAAMQVAGPPVTGGVADIGGSVSAGAGANWQFPWPNGGSLEGVTTLQMGLIIGIPSAIAATLMTALGVVLYRRRRAAQRAAEAAESEEDDDFGYAYNEAGDIVAGPADLEAGASHGRRRGKARSKADKKEKKRKEKGKERVREMEQRAPIVVGKKQPDDEEED